MYKKILVPIDDSELSVKAVKQAVNLAKELRAELVFFHAKPIKNCNDTKEFYEEKLSSSCLSFLDEALNLAKSLTVQSIKILVENNEPYKAIIDYAHSNLCDLILMASHGLSVMEGMLLGTQINKVILYSKVPALTMK